MPNPDHAALAQRIIALFDVASEREGALEHVLDPATGDIVARRTAGGEAVSDGELDLEELDLSLVCFASEKKLDAIAFLRQVDADGNGRIGSAELAAVIGSMEPMEQEGLGIKLAKLEQEAGAFEQAKAAAKEAGWVTRGAKYRELRTADGRYAAAKRAFVEALVAYARPGLG